MRIPSLFLTSNVLTFLLVAAALAQPAPQTRLSRSSESLRGVSAVSQKIAWASGTHGTYLRTTDAHIWIPNQVPGAESLDFRAVVAFSADEAFLMSAGPGDQSRIYHTLNAGRNWNLQFTNQNPKGFFDSMVFWDRTHGVVLGDPIPDESGNLKFELLVTEDGQTWSPIPAAQLPPALAGEGAFAASNSCLAILPSIPAPTQAMSSSQPVNPSAARVPGLPAAAHDLGSSTAGPASPLSTESWKGGDSSPRQSQQKEEASAPDPNIWFATGGKAARVFHSSDRGHTWEVFDTPIAHGPDSQGIFSIAFRDASHGVIAGGDYKHPDQDGANLAFTTDGGKTWTVSQIFPQSYYSAVAYDKKSLSFQPEQSVPEGTGSRSEKTCCSDASNKPDDNQAHVRLFLVGPKFIYDFRPPRNPTRISPRKKSELQFNAVSPYPSGGALFVGPKGSIATVP
jgi:photosystem II stability/assembly factor-like uncharacterized protein